MPKPKLAPLNDFCEMYRDAFGMDDKKHDRASNFFGVPPETCRDWYETNSPHPTAHRYLNVHCAGYLPYAKGWTDMYIDSEGVLHTPYGLCRAGDIAMLWRYKWASQQATRQLKAAKSKIDAMQNETTLKMLVHTADYLNRLVGEFAGR